MIRYLLSSAIPFSPKLRTFNKSPSFSVYSSPIVSIPDLCKDLQILTDGTISDILVSAEILFWLGSSRPLCRLSFLKMILFKAYTLPLLMCSFTAVSMALNPSLYRSSRIPFCFAVKAKSKRKRSLSSEI